MLDSARKKLEFYVSSPSWFIPYLLFVYIFLTPQAHARTWYIKADGTGDAPTIQAGVDSAAAGDTVLVGPGTYSDTVGVKVLGSRKVVNVRIDKSICLLGEDMNRGATIDGVNSDISILIEGIGTVVVIRRLTLTRGIVPVGCILDLDRRPSARASATYGIFGQSCSVTIEDNLILEIGSCGVYVEDCDMVMKSNDIDGADLGLICWVGSDATITGNTFYRCTSSIAGGWSKVRIADNLIDGGDRWYACEGIESAGCEGFIYGNHIEGAKFRGIDCGGGDNLVIESNFITNTAEGVFLGGSDTTRVRGNIFYRCDWAINVLRARYALIENNTIDSNGSGIICQFSTSPIIRNNIIVRAGTGVFCDVGSSPSIQCNNLFQVKYSYNDCSDEMVLEGNISADPEFCGIDDSGNYFLQSDSPCAPGNHPDGYDCGLIGAMDVNCATVQSEKRSWGSIKALYR